METKHLLEKAALSAPPPVMRKKMSANLVNLIIVLIVSALLLVSYVCKAWGYPLDSLRLFSTSTPIPAVLQLLLPLRIGVGFVFFWYGIDNFEHPQIFNNLFNVLLRKAKLERSTMNFSLLGYFQSICEAVVGITLVTGMFIDAGALLGSLLLLAVLFAYEEGLGSLLIRDVGLFGATLSLFLFSMPKL